MSRLVMVTTVDNPFDPHTQWDDWLRYDQDHHYNTNELLARVGVFSDELPDDTNVPFIEEAIDIMVECDPLKRFKKLVYEVDDEDSSDAS